MQTCAQLLMPARQIIRVFFFLLHLFRCVLHPCAFDPTLLWVIKEFIRLYESNAHLKSTAKSWCVSAFSFSSKRKIYYIGWIWINIRIIETHNAHCVLCQVNIIICLEMTFTLTLVGLLWKPKTNQKVLNIGSFKQFMKFLSSYNNKVECRRSQVSCAVSLVWEAHGVFVHAQMYGGVYLMSTDFKVLQQWNKINWASFQLFCAATDSQNIRWEMSFSHPFSSEIFEFQFQFIS